MLDDVTKASTLSCVTVGGAASQAVQAKTLSAVVAQAAAKASTLSCVTVGGAASAAAKASALSCVTVGSAAAPAAKTSVLAVRPVAKPLTPVADHAGAHRRGRINRRADDIAAMAQRAAKKHRCIIEFEKLSDEMHMLRICDDQGPEVEICLTDDPVGTLLDLFPYLVPPASEGL